MNEFKPKYELGQTIITKKPHVCGNNEWIITRTGADYKLQCKKCDRIIMLPKYELDKKVKK